MYDLTRLKDLKKSKKGATKNDKYLLLLDTNDKVKMFMLAILDGVSFKTIIEDIKEQTKDIYSTQSLKNTLKDKVNTEEFKTYINDDEFYNKCLNIVNKTRNVKK